MIGVATAKVGRGPSRHEVERCSVWVEVECLCVGVEIET